MQFESNGSESSGSEHAPAPKKQEPNQSEQLGTQGASTAPAAHKGGGPRSQQGKQKSSRNSLKHRIFSRVAIVKGESRSEFNSLLRGLCEDFKPQGTRMEVLVDKLAVLLWCQRQVFIAFVDSSLVESFIDNLAGKPKSDLLLRYLTTFDRAIDRILMQLERLQSKGQPVPPTLNENVST